MSVFTFAEAEQPKPRKPPKHPPLLTCLDCHGTGWASSFDAQGRPKHRRCPCGKREAQRIREEEALERQRTKRLKDKFRPNNDCGRGFWRQKPSTNE